MVIMHLTVPWSKKLSVKDSIGRLPSRMFSSKSKSAKAANFLEARPPDQPKLCKKFLFLGLSPSGAWISWDHS